MSTPDNSHPGLFPQISVDGKDLKETKQIANAFNDFFVNAANTVNKDIPLTFKSPNDYLKIPPPNHYFYQAISGENFSQSEYVAFGAISQFAFPPLAKAIHRAFHYVNLSNLCSKQAFRSINLSNVGFIIESQSVRIHISFRQKPINKLRFEAENSTDPYAFACID